MVASCLRNDPVAQKALYDRYKRAMYTLSFRIMGDMDQAEDVLQESFIKIFKNLGSFRQESTLGAWIKTIVVRTAYSKIRQRKVIAEPLENLPPSAVVDWGNHLDAEYLEKAILSLPEGYRTVFVLVEIEGYAHKEVAEMLGISEGTSKSQLFYAKRKLRELISEML